MRPASTQTMSNNVATWDRIVRVLAGLVLLSLVFVGPRTPLGWLGAILVTTGMLGKCPLYRLFGVSTCSVSSSPGAASRGESARG